MSRDFKCPVKSGSHPEGIEVLEISGWGRDVVGEIPRACVEALGIDCSAMDRRDAWGKPTSAIWYERSQSERMRAHKHWRAIESPQPEPFKGGWK